MKEHISKGYGVEVESNMEITDGDPQTYYVTLRQEIGDIPTQEVMLNEDELMSVMELVCKERPDFARGVSRIYFRQQKARRKALA